MAKNFRDLTEPEILALAISLEEEDGRIYGDFADGLRESYPSTAVDTRQVVAHGQSVELTRQEFDLLHLLASRPGIVFSRMALLTKIWSGDEYVTERTVDTVVSRLRKKIEHDAQDPELILTAWGVGYKFSDVE